MVKNQTARPHQETATPASGKACARPPAAFARYKDCVPPSLALLSPPFLSNNPPDLTPGAACSSSSCASRSFYPDGSTSSYQAPLFSPELRSGLWKDTKQR